MKRNKLITLGLLLVSSIAITAPLLTSCSTTLEETVVPPVVDKHKDCYFKSIESGKEYSFHDVDHYLVNGAGQHLVLKNGLNVKVNSEDYSFWVNGIWNCKEPV